MLGSKLAELRRGIERFTGGDGVHRTAIAPLSLSRASTPSQPVQTIHEPALGIVAQSSKRVMLADEIYRYDAAHFILASVDLPVTSQIIEASPESPYLALRIALDAGQVGEVILAAGPCDTPGRPQRAWRSAGSSRRCSTRSCGSCSSSIARAT